MPAAPRTTWPRSTTPPPSPVPTIAETDERSGGVGAEVHVVGVERGGVAVVVVDDGQPEPRLERPADVEAPPLGVRRSSSAPREEMTPSALAGPGVSSPTARTADARDAGRREHRRRAPSTIASTATAGPSDDPARAPRPAGRRGTAVGGQDRRVVAGAAVVEADHDPGRGTCGSAGGGHDATLARARVRRCRITDAGGSTCTVTRRTSTGGVPAGSHGRTRSRCSS